MNQKQGKRSSRDKGYYERHYAVTAANKLARSIKASKRKAAWVKRSTKKNGAPVK